MDKGTVKGSNSLTINEKLFARLYSHLFQADKDEHGAVIAAGISREGNNLRLLARDIFLAKDGVDYVPGKRGYRCLTAKFVAESADFCCSEELCYIAIHCHPGHRADTVLFSGDDLNSQQRGYPALVQMTGRPVVALVFAENAVAGNIWTANGILPLDFVNIVGSRISCLYPEPLVRKTSRNLIYDRHARLFGDEGQAILKDLKIGIVGLGGGGSLVNEWLARLGVGHIVAIDFDKVEISNLPRIVGATRWDAKYYFSKSRYALFRKLSRFLAAYKVNVARRVARKANPDIIYEAIIGDILDEPTALRLKDVDFIFLASDTIKSRNVFNALLHQYLIPGAQIGAKVRVDTGSRQIVDIFSVGRMILPSHGSGCLLCNGWIPSLRLQEELISEEERKAQKYVEDDDVHEPSVITLNVLSAAQVINDFLMMFTGIYQQGITLPHQMNDVLHRELTSFEFKNNAQCLHCSSISKSKFARGDGAKLPCRQREK
jgi:molybdopterin/thiamine biosynthesis adenylyltransferase